MIAIGNIPNSFSSDQQIFLQTLVSTLKELQQTVIPPNPPSNLKVTPKAGGNIVQFTRSNGDVYALYKSTSPSLNGATRVDLGKANQYVDDVGDAGVTVFYWIFAKTNQLTSTTVGPVSGTTLALGTTITTPTPPPASQTPTISDTDNQVVPGRPGLGVYREDL
jgi:hypothetical protein